MKHIFITTNVYDTEIYLAYSSCLIGQKLINIRALETPAIYAS